MTSTPGPRDGSEGVFRDPTPGLEARRSDLLRRQRDDLAVLPHVMRRVYVARVARTAAAIAGIVGGLLILAVSAIGPLPDLLAHVLPGKVPAPLSTLLLASWVAVAVVYLAARSAAEHRFAVAMSRCVLPGEDLQEDVQRLVREQPKLFALQMVRRLEVRSTVVPVLAFGALGPATVFYLLLAVENLGYPRERVLDEVLVNGAGALAVGVVAAGLTALAIACRWIQREHGGLLAAAAVVGWPIAAGMAIFLGTGTASLAIGPTVAAGAAAWMMRRRGREAARMEGGEAGEGETFDLRRALAAARARVARVRAAFTVANARRAVRRLAVEHTAGLVTLLLTAGIVAGLYALSPGGGQPSPAMQMVAASTSPTEAPGDMSEMPGSEAIGRALIANGRGGGVLIDVSVPESSEGTRFSWLDLAELPAVPRGWTARVTISIVSTDGGLSGGDLPPALVVSPVPGNDEIEPKLINDYLRQAEFAIRNCGGEPPRLGLLVARPKNTYPLRKRHVTLRYSAVMELGGCPI
jgi:hypothetical protein